MIRLHVFLTMPTGATLLAGELVTTEPDERGALAGQFRYDQDYLSHPYAFALDPVALPLGVAIYDADRPYAGVHGVFEDSLPDDWGRRILLRRYMLGRSEQRVPNLLKVLGAKGLGGLSYRETADVIPEKACGVESRYLKELLQLAESFECSSVGRDEELTLLFQAGSSPGGARPKVIVEDANKSWLAKFPSVHDQFDVVRLEAATMSLARTSGVDAANSILQACGEKHILLVERFDVTPQGGRNHVVSMQTLLGADGHYSLSYRDVADILRRFSADPGGDLLKLYRQMLFHALIGNTDDHLKNFCMLHGINGWCLSPAFDILPNVGQNTEHVLRIGNDYRTPQRETLLGEAKVFGIKRKKRAGELLDEMCETVRGWRGVFTDHGVPHDDCQVLGRDIDMRLQKAQGRR